MSPRQARCHLVEQVGDRLLIDLRLPPSTTDSSCTSGRILTLALPPFGPMVSSICARGSAPEPERVAMNFVDDGIGHQNLLLNG
jgi:hypothetical protein